MSDDHAAHAISAYGSVINSTPNIDRIAAGGARLTSAFCTNSICSPSRASILTGTYNHVNGVTTLEVPWDASQQNFVAALHDSGYQTAIIGKWHLGHGDGHDPQGCDYWQVLPGQGAYHDPEFLTAEGRQVVSGYVTDLITDKGLEWLDERDRDRPFCLLLHHKAPHRHWEPDEGHAHLYEDVDIPIPETFHDDYSNRSEAARAAVMRVARDLDLKIDLKEDPPQGLSERQYAEWAYQRYIKDYLRCVASIDDNVGRVLDYLDSEELADDTIIVYTSDQGFFLGDHGWYDKRFMYEESLRMPFLIRYPREIPAGSQPDEIILNVDWAQTFLDYAGVPEYVGMQGRSARSVLAGSAPADWRQSMYYRYWMHDEVMHHVRAHCGVRTHTHKLICYYGTGESQPGSSDSVFPPEWELFDLETDPHEMHNVYDDPAHAEIQNALTRELRRLIEETGDESPEGLTAPSQKASQPGLGPTIEK